MDLISNLDTRVWREEDPNEQAGTIVDNKKV